MNLKNTVLSLAAANGVSGEEGDAAKLALEMLSPYCDEAYIKNNCVFGRIGEPSRGGTILLEAHIDQIGFIVNYITDDGFLKVSNVGGIDKRILPAQGVTVHGKEKIRGVIISIPPHLSTDGKPAKDIYVDIGMSKEEAEKVISLGDKVTFECDCGELLGDRVFGRALDDRAGCAAVIRAAELISENKPDCCVMFLLATQEEVGSRGARIGAFAVNPDAALIVDVSFGYADGEEEDKCGKLGCGPMIGFSPAISAKMSGELIDIAKKAEIPYQLEVMGGSTGTDADAVSVTARGVMTGMASIPLRYMHTPVEVISISDVENTAKLFAEYVSYFGYRED